MKGNTYKESSEVLKRLLVNMLIRDGHIDGFKQIGAGCAESRAFVDNEGHSLAEKKFRIKCCLSYSDCLSYQDSFKFYDYGNNVAYNFCDVHYTDLLDTTDYNLNGDEEEERQYDEYHDYNCDEVRLCYVHGEETYVDVENLEDFVYVPSRDEYHHKDDVAYCLQCERAILKADAVYNNVEEDWFCDAECEEDYKEAHWFYSNYEDKYYPNEDDITVANIWDERTQGYEEVSISCDLLDTLISQNQAFGSGETWFINSNAMAA